MRKSSLASVSALVAMAALSAGMATSTPQQADGRVMTIKAGDTSPNQGRIAQTGAQDRRTRRVLSSFLSAGFNQKRRSGPGWTNMHAKRVATKKRNVKRFHGRA